MPGNLRQLQSLLRVGAIKCTGGVLRPEDVGRSTSSGGSDLFFRYDLSDPFQFAEAFESLRNDGKSLLDIAKCMSLAPKELMRIISTNKIKINCNHG